MGKFINTRYYFAAVVIACTGLLVFGLYLEHYRGMEPCPLCVFQRMAFIAVLAIAVLATVHGPRAWGRYLYNGLLLFVSLIGGGIAARQVWLQHLPADQVPACGPGLDYILDAFPPVKALQMIFSGSGECAEIHWQFMGLSIAEWSLAWFMLFVILAIAGLYSQRAAGKIH